LSLCALSTFICKVNILICPLMISLLTASFHNTSLNRSDRPIYPRFSPIRSISTSPFLFSVPSLLFLPLLDCETQGDSLRPPISSPVFTVHPLSTIGPSRLPLLFGAAVPSRQSRSALSWRHHASIKTLSRPSLPGRKELISDRCRADNGWIYYRSLLLLLPIYTSTVPSLLWRCRFGAAYKAPWPKHKSPIITFPLHCYSNVPSLLWRRSTALRREQL
jgi:hypothetical protein